MTFTVVNKIRLDLPEYGEFFHIYTLSVLQSGCVLAFGASFENQESVDDAYGETKVLSLGKSITVQTKFEDLQIRSYEPDSMHIMDIIAPSWKVQCLTYGDEELVLAQMNQSDSPFMLRCVDGVLTEHYKYYDNTKPTILRSQDLDSNDTYGVCLGFAIFKNQMPGSPEKILKDFYDEEFEFPWPPHIFMLEIDGTLKWWQFTNKNWRDKSLLQPCLPAQKSEKQEESKE